MDVHKKFRDLIGRTIIDVRNLTQAESDQLGLEGSTFKPLFGLVLDSDDLIVPVSDAEGNQPGWIFIVDPNLSPGTL